MKNEFGQSFINDLIRRKSQSHVHRGKYTVDELKEIGDLYKEFADQLKKDKML